MTVLSLCDYSGNWPEPYARAGHRVILVDPKHKPGRPDRFGCTVEEFAQTVTAGNLDLGNVRVVLAAPPCTHFTVSGAQYWKAKDADGRTDAALEIIDACLSIIAAVQPDVWALENPVGRLPRLRPLQLGRPRMYFQPHHYAGHADDPQSEAYTKRTGLWGFFNTDLPLANVEPVFLTASNGDRYAPLIMKTGGKSERTKELRSVTPHGFARAFFQANRIQS